jgi:hypothetical protein
MGLEGQKLRPSRVSRPKLLGMEKAIFGQIEAAPLYYDLIC